MLSESIVTLSVAFACSIKNMDAFRMTNVFILPFSLVLRIFYKRISVSPLPD